MREAHVAAQGSRLSEEETSTHMSRPASRIGKAGGIKSSWLRAEPMIGHDRAHMDKVPVARRSDVHEQHGVAVMSAGSKHSAGAEGHGRKGKPGASAFARGAAAGEPSKGFAPRNFRQPRPGGEATAKQALVESPTFRGDVTPLLSRVDNMEDLLGRGTVWRKPCGDLCDEGEAVELSSGSDAQRCHTPSTASTEIGMFAMQGVCMS